MLRLAPAGDSEPLHSASNSDRLNNPVELTDKSMRYALNNSSLFVLDFYYPGCGPCKLMNNTTMELSEELGGAGPVRQDERQEERKQQYIQRI